MPEVPGGEPLTDPPWDAWSPRQVARLLAGVDAPWYVAGGWALDLFLGRTSREHEDLEIAVPSARFPSVRAALAAFEVDVVGSGRRWMLGSQGAEQAAAENHQTWVRDEDGTYRLDIFREPHDGGTWICRRDESIRLPYREIIERTPDGVPYLVPQIVLLFKAKALRDKDHGDFERVLPELDAARRGWLAAALARVHPGHPWAPALGSLRSIT